MAFLAQFVDSIAASPTVRLSLQAIPTWRVHIDGTEFPPPPLRRSVVQTLLADGAVIPSSAYDLRTLRLVLSVFGTPDQVATQLQNLARELDRPRNVFMWQQETTQPIFFRTFRTSADSIVDLGMYDGTRKLISVEIPAEPFGYGLREDPVSSVTVNFDPAAGGNGGFFDIAGNLVKGDVETPVKITFPSSLAGQSLIAVRRRGTPSATPWFIQAEALTVGADTTTQANDATMSGAGNNWTRTTFAGTPGLATRLSTTAYPATPSVDARGIYRVFGRMKKTVSGDVIKVEITYGPGNLVADGGLVTLPSVTSLVMVDFGLISIPASSDPITDMVTGTEIAAVGTNLNFVAQRVSGSGNLDMDVLWTVPADDRLAIINWGAFTPPTDWVLDGVAETIYGRDASARVATVAADTVYIGGSPMLTPNQAHRVFFLYRTDPGIATTIGTTTSISLSYYPRYLYVRPAST